MLKILVVLVCALTAISSHAEDITGAGSTAAAPLYSKWEQAYAKKSDLKLSYESIGSSGGIKKIKENAVGFGASDAPMSSAELKASNLMDFPTVISGVVPFYNLPGIKPGELRLTPEILVGIYMGDILKWDDPAIVKANPDLNLPKQAIIPYARLDGSGTTFTLTDYFTRVSPKWKDKFGTDFKIAWPSNVTQIKGSNDIVATLKKTPYSMGYTEYAYIIENNLSFAQLKNRDGVFVKPSAVSFRAALAKSGWGKTGNFEEMLTDKSGSGSWPITGGTYILVPRVTKEPQRTAAALKFFTWAFIHGDEIANSLDYIRLPDAVQGRVYHEISSIEDTQGNQLVVSIEME